MEFLSANNQNPSIFIGYLYRNFKNYCDERLAPYQLTSSNYFYLHFIAKYEGCSLIEMVHSLKADKAYVTRSVSRLEQLGYVIKEKSTQDRRAYILTLSDCGRKVMKELSNLFSDWNDDLVKEMEQEEYSQFVVLLEKVAAIKDKNSGDRTWKDL